MKDRIRSAFAEIRADDVLMGQTAAYLHRELEKRRQKNKRFVLPKLVGAFAAALVVVVGIFAYSLYFTAAAYVSIDVNPSVELTLNRFDRVIGAYAFNEDGARVLSEFNPRGKKYDEAAGLLVSAIDAGGYFTKDILVSVTVQAASGDRERILCDTLQQSIDRQVLYVQTIAEVEVIPVSAEVWQGAHGCNMSPAKYLAIQELLEVDADATIEAYGDSTISQIRRRAQECRNAYHTEAEDSTSEAGGGSWNGYGHGQGNGNSHGHGCRGGH